MIDGVEEAAVTKLKQKKQTLEGKAELLIRLDSEIIELVPDEGLEEEIERADEVREEIELAILDLDAAIEAMKLQPRITRGRRPGTGTDTPLEHEEAEETLHDDGDETPTADPPGTMDLPTTDTSLSMDRPDPDDGNETPTADLPGTLDLHTTDTPLSVDRPNPPAPGTTAVTVLRAHAPNVKLPKLSLKKYNGNLVKWTTFWDTFESSVHIR